MSVLPDFAHHRPTTTAEALGLISFDAPPYSGGTELLLAMRAGLLRPEALVDLKNIEELQGVEEDDDGVILGGGVTHQSAIDSPVLQAKLPILGEVLENVGNPRVRAVGTLSGNLCFAEPKSDVATILGALEASVVLRSEEQSRTVAVSDFVMGPYTSAREEGEILTAIRIPEREQRPVVYSKYQTMERPTAGIAAAITSDDRCRVVVGAAGGRPEAIDAARPGDIDPEELATSIEVIPDMTGSERYKRHIVAVHISRALAQLETML